jgi:hypothetical protein
MNDEALWAALFTALILGILYKKLRRSVGRQKWSRARLAIRILLFGTLSAVMAALIAAKGWIFLSAAVFGAALAWLAVRLTRFDRDDDARYYTPNPIIGLTVFGLFLGRLVYRLEGIVPALASKELDAQSILSRLQDREGPPITLALLLLLFAFYTCYYCGVLVRQPHPAASRVRA